MSGVRGLERQEFQLKGGGKLTLWEEGALVHMQAARSNDGRGLYKVWLHGQGGRLLLGTLAPEGDGLRLRRRLTRSELERGGCWPVTGGETVLAFAFEVDKWLREERPERLVTDVVLRRALGGQTMLLRRRKNGFCLAAPFDIGRPFPLTTLFCLAKPERVEGRSYVVFSFDREGNPVLPHNGSNTGENSGTS